MKETAKELSPSQRIGVTVAAVALVMVVCGLIWVVIPAVSNNDKTITGVAASRIASASKAYSRALRDRGQPVPASIPLSDLVKLGYLRTQDTEAFEGMDTQVGLQTNEALPVYAIMRVKMSDGSIIILHGDGSVQTEGRSSKN